MLLLNTKKDKPNFGYFKNQVDRNIKEFGIRFKPEIHEEYQKVLGIFTETKARIEKDYGIANLASPKKLKDYLLSLNNAEIESLLYDAKKKKYSTDKEAMKKLADRNYQIGEEILLFRDLDSKRKHFNQLIEFMDVKHTIRPITVYSETNRLIYKDPGLMAINKEIIKKYLAPIEEDEILVSVDVSSQEPKIVANILGIGKLADLDNLYESIAEQALGLTAITETQRDQIKSAHNAIAYGSGEREIIRICKDLNGKALYQFYSKIPEFKEYRKKCEYFARRGVKTSFTLFDTEITSTGHGYLVGTMMNAPMQGTASDINCLLAENFFKNKPYGMEMYFPRVDEAIIRVQPNVKDYEQTIKDLFEHKVDDWSPFHVKVKTLNK